MVAVEQVSARAGIPERVWAGMGLVGTRGSLRMPGPVITRV